MESEPDISLVALGAALLIPCGILVASYQSGSVGLIPMASGLGWAVCVLFGAWVSRRRRRPWWEGAACAFLLGPIGVILAAVLPPPPT